MRLLGSQGLEWMDTKIWRKWRTLRSLISPSTRRSEKMLKKQFFCP